MTIEVHNFSYNISEIEIEYFDLETNGELISHVIDATDFERWCKANGKFEFTDNVWDAEKETDIETSGTYPNLASYIMDSNANLVHLDCVEFINQLKK